MQPSQQNSLQDKIIPPISVVLFLTIFLYISFSSGMNLLNDGDTGYHIRVGDYILEHKILPKQDMFSHHTPPLPWTAHEWLSEIIMSLVHKAYGLNGIVIFFSAFLAFSYACYYNFLKSYRANFYLTLILTISVIASSKIHWLARPHVFSILIMVIWLRILEEYQHGTRDRLYLLPLIMILWANLHGGYIIGIVLIGIYWLDGAFSRLTAKVPADRANAAERFKKLGFVMMACAATAMINPIGYKILLFPFKLTGDTYLMDHVGEFLSPNFHDPLFYRYVLILLLGVLALSVKRLRCYETIIILFFVNISLVSVRYIPLCVIFITPIMLRQIQEMISASDSGFLRALTKRSDNLAAVDAASKWPLLKGAVIFLLVLVIFNDRLKWNFDPKTKPVAAVEFLKKEHINGNMFNNDEFGDYLIYASPAYKPFIDGRLDMYGSKIMKEYYKIVRFEPGWEKILEKYEISWFLIPSGDVLYRHLLEAEGWQLVYSDKVAAIIVKDDPAHKEQIARHQNVLPVFPDEPKDKSK